MRIMNTQAKNKQEPQESVEPGIIRDKILHILKLYPIISPTMLQGGLGPYMKPIQWRPVLENLIAQGVVVESQRSRQTHQERYNTYTFLHLAETKLTHIDS